MIVVTHDHADHTDARAMDEIGYVVQGGGIYVYVACDSRLHPALPAIAERFEPVVSILSCDGTRLAGGDLHVMTPEDAVSAARTLRSKLVLPSGSAASCRCPVSWSPSDGKDLTRFVNADRVR